MTYRRFQIDITPAPLRGPNGQLWAGGLGSTKDDLAARATEAVKAGYVLRCPVDALARHGEDTRIERYPSDTDASYRARIAGAWNLWPWVGTDRGIRAILTLLGLTVTAVVADREWLPDAPPDGRTDLWSRWWAIIPGHPWSLDIWDDPGDWDDGGTWDTDATLEEVTRLRRAVRQFSNAQHIGFIRLIFGASGDVWGPEEPWDSGTWDADTATFVDWRVD